MSIVYDYRGIGVMMKGDDWWTAAPREPEPVETTHVEPPKAKVSAAEIINRALYALEANVFLKGLQRDIDTFVYQTMIPASAWHQINAGKPLDIRPGQICTIETDRITRSTVGVNEIVDRTPLVNPAPPPSPEPSAALGGAIWPARVAGSRFTAADWRDFEARN